MRYTWWAPDLNRARWRSHPIWEAIQREVAGDLFEMASCASPRAVREVRRKDFEEMLMNQTIGLAANLAHLRGLTDSSVSTISDHIAERIQRYACYEPEAFDAKRQRAAERYHFL